MSKFEHSVPVPHVYKRAAIIAKEVKENGGNLKSLIYSEKRIKEIKAIYALAAETLQHSQQIDFLLKRTQLLEKEPRLQPWIAKVLIAELFWGKRRLWGECKPIKTLLAYQQILNAHFNDIYEEEEKERKVTKPRYVRINSLKTSIDKAITLFKEEGWIYVECDKKDYESFLQKVANLGEEEFMSDIHIEDLLIFPPGTTFHNHEAYWKGSIVLQDKASCLPVHILNPPPNAKVLDMCAAPGMKTSHLAAKMKNKGLIYAVDFDAERFVALEKLMNRLGVTCVKTINNDVLSLTEKDCPGIEYILVDPSCSGSGIVDRLDFDYPQTQATEERLKKLAGLQILMLKHALRRFPNVKKIVYSTCSINPEENEAVVQEVLNNYTYFKLVPADSLLKSQWLNFGSPEFVEIGKKCLYAKPDVDQTNGFFVAIFERVKDSNKFIDVATQQDVQKKKREKEFEVGDAPDKKRSKIKVNVNKNATGNVNENKDNINDKVKSKKKKRKHSEIVSVSEENETNEQNPEKMIKIDEEDKEMNDIECFSKVERGGAVKNKTKRIEQKYSEIDSSVEEKENIIADGGVKIVNEKKKLKKNGVIKTVEKRDNRVGNISIASEPKKQKREKNKEFKNTSPDHDIKNDVDVNILQFEVQQQIKKRKVKNILDEEETKNLKTVSLFEKEEDFNHQDKGQSQKKKKKIQIVLARENEEIQHNLYNSDIKRKKLKNFETLADEVNKNFKKQKREKKEEADGKEFKNQDIITYEEEEITVHQIEKQKGKKIKRTKNIADDPEIENVESKLPEEAEEIINSEIQEQKRKKRKKIKSKADNAQIKNEETLLSEEEYINYLVESQDEKRNKQMKIPADEETKSYNRKHSSTTKRKKFENEEQNSFDDIEKQKMKKKK